MSLITHLFESTYNGHNYLPLPCYQHFLHEHPHKLAVEAEDGSEDERVRAQCCCHEFSYARRGRRQDNAEVNDAAAHIVKMGVYQYLMQFFSVAFSQPTMDCEDLKQSALQRRAKKGACFAKQQPGRVRQKIHAT